MFAKNKVTQSMLDAVNSVINEAETKEPTKKKPDWLINAEKAAEAKEGKLKEDSEQLDEIDANAILGMAKKVAPNAKMRGSVEDQKKERDAMMAQREKDRPAKEAETNARIKKDTEELKKKHKPEDIKKQMDDVKKKYEASHGEIEKNGHQYSNGSSYEQGKELMNKYHSLKNLHKRITEDKDEPFINAVSRVINGEKNVRVEEESLQEKNWIKGAIKHPGALTTAAKKAGETNSEYEQQHKHDSGTAGKRARLALTLKKMHHEEVESLQEKNWIKGAIKHPGALTTAAKKAGETNSEYEQQHKHDSGTAGKRARLALTLKKMHHEEVESLDELSKDTLTSYGNKAAAQAHSLDGQLEFGRWTKKSKDALTKQMIKRNAGVRSAEKRLSKEEFEQMDEVENAFTAYKNKRPSELGRHLTRKHDAKRLSDTSVMYTKKHGKDLESAKDAGDAHNASVYAKQKMKKEEFETEEFTFEAKDWVVKGAKTGTDKEWGSEKTKKMMTKEDTGLDTPVPTKPKTTDTLAGRIKVPKNFHNQHVDSKIELKAEEAHPDAAEDKKLISKMIKKDDEKEEKKDKQKDVKLIKNLIKKDDARMKKEAVDFGHIHGEHLKIHTGPHKGKEGVLHDIHGHIFEVKPNGAKSEKDHVFVPQEHTTIIHQQNEEYNAEAFHGPEAGSGVGDSPMVTNDSKPVKLAKYLAVKTADKMKNEMLGKMTN